MLILFEADELDKLFGDASDSPSHGERDFRLHHTECSDECDISVSRLDKEPRADKRTAATTAVRFSIQAAVCRDQG